MPESSAPPPKRTKLFRACDSCVASKTRCDDLTAEGCSLCRRKHKRCSLLEEEDQSSFALMPGSNLRRDGESTSGFGFNAVQVALSPDTRTRLDMVEARTWDLELRVRQIEVNAASVPSLPVQTPILASGNNIPLDPIMGGSISVPTRTHSTPDVSGYFGQNAVAGPSRLDVSSGRGNISAVASGKEEYDLRVLDDMKKTQFWPFDENLFSLCGRKGYPDVVKSGLMTQTQVDMSFQLWKHRSADILPLAPFLLTTTPTPSHPFVVLAIIAQLERYPSAEMFEMINESIRQALLGAVSVDVVLALLIGTTAGTTPELPSRSRIISIAYEIGKALGMESNTLAGLEMGEELCQPWWRERYEEMLLWENVKCQYNYIHMASCRVHTILPSHVGKLPLPPGDHYRIAMDYLRRKDSLIEAFRPHLENIAKAESLSLFGAEDTINLTESWSSLQVRLENHRRINPPPPGDMGSTFLEFYLGYRTIKFYQRLPTPISLDIKMEGHNAIGVEMLRLSTTIVDYFIDLDLDSTACQLYPQTLGVVVGAIGTILAVYAVVYKQHPNFLGINIERTKMAAEKVHRNGGIPSRILRKMREEFAAALDVPEPPVDLGSTSNGIPFDFGMEGEMLDPDISAWTFLFNSMPDMSDSLDSSFSFNSG